MARAKRSARAGLMETSGQAARGEMRPVDLIRGRLKCFTGPTKIKQLNRLKS